MKRIITLMLAFVLVFAFAACGDGEEAESSVFNPGSSAAESTEESLEESSEAAVSEDASEDESVAGDESETVSEDTSDESGEPETSEPETSEPGEETAPDFIDQFISVGVVDTKVTATTATSIRLTGVDVDPSYGAIILYTSDYGILNADLLSDFAVAVFEYDHDVFGYVMTSFTEVGKADKVKIPSDGFVVAAHSFQASYIDKLKAIPKTETVFPHGVHLYDGVDHKIEKTDKAPEIDGIFKESEWKKFHIEDINDDNKNWSYSQFELNKYYATASYYTTYDDEYLYLCVVVDSPYHYCPITTAKPGDMWQYECIQAKISSESPAGDYIFKNFDRVANKTAENDGVIRNFGFAATDSGETAYYQSGTSYEDFEGKVACVRDDASQTTVYEVAIPFASVGIEPKKGTEFGFTFSINSTNDEDFANGKFKNITLRNGGGVIGRNDWTKIPVITLD